MKKPFKINHPFLRLAQSIILVVVAAWLLSVYFFRIDLTSEKRYTLSQFSKKTLRELDTVVVVKVYLDGDLNIPFRKMQQRLRETLEEFQVYSGKKLEYEIINPFKGKDAKAVDKNLDILMSKGLKPTNILAKDKEGGTSEKLVLPGALVCYKGLEIPVNLLKNNPAAGAEENINNSIQAFEFEFIRIISSLSAGSVEKIAFIEGHGEYNEFQVGDITRELGWYFQVDRGKINGTPGILNQYKAVVIAGPTLPFNEQDKYVLDQYLMEGGRVLWFVDMVNASLDSIKEGGATIALIRMLNIEDMLFRYGVRINPVLLQDGQCSMIPVNLALAGNPPDFRPVPWLYSPLLNAPSGHPVTRNLNMIRSEFSGCIDTIEARKGIRKTALLSTSQVSRKVAAPVIIGLEEVRIPLKPEMFTEPFLPVAVLLEGRFESVFRNRSTSDIFPDTLVTFKETGNPASVFVAADADLIRNEFRPTPNGMMITPLGFDRYTQQTYGNKEFIVNAIQYMTGHEGLIRLRSRDFQLRLLDKATLKSDRRKWILINTLTPPLLVILAGLVYTWIRKRKYGRAS
ncbi:MAG: gliding motility-associated ABC transporter substrate-binding protein GldG [Bacteroidales bacterium]|nr:gliding motility-associated ABC transporter substrate-binding protein GldG [Bacteroidales bacterium]